MEDYEQDPIDAQEPAETPEPVAPQDPEVFLQSIMDARNIADLLDDVALAKIGSDVVREHRIDYSSMDDWRGRMDRGIALASLIKEEKSYPFERSSNVKYPLITTAALQFNARAYPAILPDSEVVKCKTFGKDPTGKKAARAARVATHMSWQLSSQIDEWEESTDELLTVLPIVGTMVRKVWHDPVMMRPRCRLIAPGDFVVNSRVKSLTDAPRVGEILHLYPTEIRERQLAKTFRSISFEAEYGEDPDAPHDFVEQHRRLDLDDDGYPEPYIVTVHIKTERVARIVADFGPDDVTLGPEGVAMIRRGSYFVAYHFLPSMDGGFFGIGFGFLLGDISDAINSVINMMMDAGHMSARGGGFIGSEFRISGGSQQFKPGEWKPVGARGGDIKAAIVPMTFPGPDATLFQLLGLLIDAGREVASVQDIMTGDTGGRTQTATTTLALIEQGMAVFTAAYKRIFRSLKQEFKLLAKINRENLDPAEYARFHDMQGHNGGPPMDGMPQGHSPDIADPRSDYDLRDMDIEPVADPRSVTRMQEAAKAQVIMQLADAGMIDKGEALKRILHAVSIPEVDQLLPKPDPMQGQMMQMAAQAAQADLVLKMVSVDQAIADLEKTRSETMKNAAGAAAQAAMVRLDHAKLQLEAIRDAIGATLGGNSGGMAGASGNGNGARLPAVQSAMPPAAGSGGILGGGGMAGLGAAGAVAGVGPMG